MPAPIVNAENPRVLLIRPTALGDVSRTVPALVTLRNAMPHAQIDWLVRSQFADVIRHHPALNNIIDFQRDKLGRLTPRGVQHFRQWSLRLREGRYDITVDLQGLARSGIFSWLTRAPRRIGFANAREFAWLCYTERHHVDASHHAVDRMLGLMQAAGYDISHDMTLHVGAEDRHWLNAYLNQNGIASTTDGGDSADYFVLAPTARWRCKCWPLDRYIEIGKRLLASGDAGSHVVIIASPTEQAYIQPLIDALSTIGRVHFPSTTVGQMMAVLERAALLVCNDSAPLHIAVGLNRRLVTIFGPTDPALVGPYRRDSAVVQPPKIKSMGPRAYRQHKDDQSLIAQVEVDAVWQRISDTLDSKI